MTGKARREARDEGGHRSWAHLSVLFFRHIEEEVTSIRAKAERRQVLLVSTLSHTHVNTSASGRVHVLRKLGGCVKQTTT